MFTRLESVKARLYFVEEVAPNQPIRLPHGYPEPPQGEHLLRVEVADRHGAIALLPYYVPAEDLIAYERFAAFVLKTTGRPFLFRVCEESHSDHAARVAWRLHVAEACQVESLPRPAGAPVLSPELAGAAVTAWRVGWEALCIECFDFTTHAAAAPIFRDEVEALTRQDCDRCSRDLREVADGPGGAPPSGKGPST